MHVLVEKLLVVKIKKNMKLNVKKLVFIINLFFNDCGSFLQENDYIVVFAYQKLKPNGLYIVT